MAEWLRPSSVGDRHVALLANLEKCDRHEAAAASWPSNATTPAARVPAFQRADLSHALLQWLSERANFAEGLRCCCDQTYSTPGYRYYIAR